jgi:uncharacterized protein
MKRVVTEVPAPRDLGTEVIGVPEGAPVALDLRLEAVMEGVLVSGTAVVPLVGECARCLDEIHDTATVELRELYFYPDRADEFDPDDDAPSLVEDHLDLEPALRDALVLELPLSPRCAPDCPGLCVECGARLADAGPDHTHDAPDPRWAALAALKQDGAALAALKQDGAALAALKQDGAAPAALKPDGAQTDDGAGGGAGDHVERGS